MMINLKEKRKSRTAVKMEINEESINKVLSTEYEWDLIDNRYFMVKLLDYTICVMEDSGIQRLLREVENSDLAIAMKGLSIESKKALLNNLSKRLASLICEDVEFMGPVSTDDCAEAAQKIMKKAIKLMSIGLIPDDEYRIISRMTKIFAFKEDEITNEEETELVSELEYLFETYKGIRRRLIV